MSSSNGENAPSKETKESPFKAFLTKLRKRHIIETLAAFIAGGWLIIEFVHFILNGHYHFPEKTLDVMFITLICVLLCTLIWRWFSGREAPRKFKLELVLIPLVLLITVLLDINLLLHLKTPEPEAVPAAKWKNSIAVLPFVDMSPRKDQEYFCDGMTEELINRLSNIKELKVPARTSVFTFKGKAADIREIGKKLDVQNILEGSIRKEGSQLRITVQLVNVSDSFHIWSETFDKELTRVFEIQDEISLAVADKLKLTLLREEKAKLAKRPTENLEAYNLYLQGRFLIDKGTHYFGQARDYFSQAIELDPNYALAYAGLADVYTWLCLNGAASSNEFMPRASEAAHNALEIVSDVSEIWTLGRRLIAPFASDATSPNHSSGISGNTKPRDRQEPGNFAADGSAVASAFFGSSRRGPGEGRPKTGSTSADNSQENQNRDRSYASNKTAHSDSLEHEDDGGGAKYQRSVCPPDLEAAQPEAPFGQYL